MEAASARARPGGEARAPTPSFQTRTSREGNAEGDDEIVAGAVEGEAKGDDEIVADAVIPSSSAAFRETVEPSASASGSPSGENAEASKPQASGKAKASVQLGGKVGVHRPEAFTAPPEGVDVREFSEGTGHFYPKMPCLECGSPWWLGDDWDAECANCGEGADRTTTTCVQSARSISADSNSFGNSSTRSIAAEGRRRDEIRDEPVERVVSRCLCLSLWTPRGLFFDCSRMKQLAQPRSD